MYENRKYQPISYHDTWMSLDPIYGCPYSCKYCILQHSETTGMAPRQMISVKEFIENIKNHPFFVLGKTPLAIGNETDILHTLNVGYLVELLEAIKFENITNPIILITKTHLSDKNLKRIREAGSAKIIFFLSYSGLSSRYEPNFSREGFEHNFELVRDNGFPIVHYWRPLMAENTTIPAIQKMLSFSSSHADSAVFIGLKLHPKLTAALIEKGHLHIPSNLLERRGEWIDQETIDTIYREAKAICPDFPLYRHASCALDYILGKHNHTATIYRQDVCIPSHCPVHQRKICEAARRLPTKEEISNILSALNRDVDFQYGDERIIINSEVTQEEFAYLLHNLNYPLEVHGVKMQSLYYGDIFSDQLKIPANHE